MLPRLELSCTLSASALYSGEGEQPRKGGTKGQKDRPMETVSFTRMEDVTAEEYLCLRGVYIDHHKNVADEVLVMLGKLAGPMLGYKIDRYQHSLQSASRAQPVFPKIPPE